MVREKVISFKQLRGTTSKNGKKRKMIGVVIITTIYNLI